MIAAALAGAAWYCAVVFRDSAETGRGLRGTLEELAWLPLWPAAAFGAVAGWIVGRGRS